MQYFYRQQDVSFLAQTTTNLLLTDVIGLGTGDDYERGGKTISGRVLCNIHTLQGGFLDMARYMDILHVLNYWILGIFDFFVVLPLELENMVRFLNF